jgi:toxin YoeB
VYQLLYSPSAKRDARKVAKSHLKKQCIDLLDIISQNPYQNPPPYEKLSGDLEGCLSRRLNVQHRLVYEIDEKAKIIKIWRMWTHY